MVSRNSSGPTPANSSQFAGLVDKIKNCQGCEQRKEYLKDMFGKNFLVGVVVGVGATWAYHKYVKK